MRFSSLLVHHPGAVDPVTGALSAPIYQASTFQQDDLENPPRFDYARSGNPTRQALEDTIAVLEGGCRGFAFSSGMAAISSVLAIFSAGDHLIVCEDSYGGTYRATSTIFPRFGFDVTYVDTTDLDAVRRAVRPTTKAIYFETPSNPLLKVTDIHGIVAIAHEHGAVAILDDTFLSPYLVRPLGMGVDIVVHSATKFIAGHTDVVAGLACVADEGLADRVYAIQNGFGAVLGPHDAWLVLRGLKTLKVRLDYQQRNATALARWLEARPEVRAVYYPGLATHVGHDLHASQSDGPGAVLSFRVTDGIAARAFLARLKMANVAVSLGGVETIVSYPVTMSHAAMPEPERARRGITDDLLRVSVGNEDLDDLEEDFAQALVASSTCPC